MRLSPCLVLAACSVASAPTETTGEPSDEPGGCAASPEPSCNGANLVTYDAELDADGRCVYPETRLTRPYGCNAQAVQCNNCSSNCDTAGEERCLAGDRSVCTADGGGCLRWEPAGACCVHTCDDGEATCDGDQRHVCEPDADGCRRMVPADSCEHGCSAGACLAGSR